MGYSLDLDSFNKGMVSSFMSDSVEDNRSGRVVESVPAAESGAHASVPALVGEDGLGRYLREIQQFPLLAPQEEMRLARAWRDAQDRDAAHQLVTSHLRLVAKIAMGYRGYGLPVSELISEGNIGLMRAVRRFDPDKGFRLTTYAVWWIRAAIQEYVLRSWSLVKIGTTAAQKKLFFNLRKARGEIELLEGGHRGGALRPGEVKQIAQRLGVGEGDVEMMERRLAGQDYSLNVKRGEDDDSGEWQDWIADEQEGVETTLAVREEETQRHDLLMAALETLNEREREIITRRRLVEAPETLEALSADFGVSRERIRQIEMRAFEKLQKHMRPKLGAKRADIS